MSMTQDQKRVFDFVIGNGFDGTWLPSQKDHLIEDVLAVNRVLGCKLVARQMTEGETDRRIYKGERWWIVENVDAPTQCKS